jgi:hypothetical protein
MLQWNFRRFKQTSILDLEINAAYHSKWSFGITKCKYDVSTLRILMAIVLHSSVMEWNMVIHILHSSPMVLQPILEPFPPLYCAASGINPDHGGSTYLWNVGRQLFYTAVRPRRQFWTSYSPPWELEISHFICCLLVSCVFSSFSLDQSFSIFLPWRNP